MLESRNFKDKSVIENLTDAELECLINIDSKGSSHGRNTIVALIHDNFENKGRRLFIAIPKKREGFDKLHYQGFLLDSWDKPPALSECVNSYFATKQDVLLMADALYGAEDIIDQAMRENKARMEIQNRHRENPNQREILSPEEIRPAKHNAKNEEFTRLDKMIETITPPVEDENLENKENEITK